MEFCCVFWHVFFKQRQKRQHICVKNVNIYNNFGTLQNSLTLPENYAQVPTQWQERTGILVPLDILHLDNLILNRKSVSYIHIYSHPDLYICTYIYVHICKHIYIYPLLVCSCTFSPLRIIFQWQVINSEWNKHIGELPSISLGGKCCQLPKVPFQHVFLNSHFFKFETGRDSVYKQPKISFSILHANEVLKEMVKRFLEDIFCLLHSKDLVKKRIWTFTSFYSYEQIKTQNMEMLTQLPVNPRNPFVQLARDSL